MEPIRFGKYFLIEMIASGGMAEIYKAMVKSSDQQFHTLAIKRILPQFSHDEEFISLLTDEAKVMVFLNHPNIVSIVEFGKVEGSYYIAMEFINGATLQGLFRKVKESGEQFPIYIALYIVREIAMGLAYAHRKTDQHGNALNLVHRDISPGNILLSFDGETKITDFGISKVSNQNHETQIGVIRGKTGYMSPEQTRAGTTIDSRTDLYALGIILYELITGERLFKADTVPQALKLIREGKIASPRQFRPEIHPNLETLMIKALSQDPNQRFQTGEEFSDAINEFLARFYTGPKKRVTHTDLVEFISRYFQISTQEQRQEEKRTNEKTLSNVEFDAKMERAQASNDDEPTSSKVFAANPLFSLESTDRQLPEAAEKPKIVVEKNNTESLVQAAKGSMSVVAKPKSKTLKVYVLILIVLAGSLFLWKKYEDVIMDLFKPIEVEVLVESSPPGAQVTVDQLLWNQQTPTKVKLIRGTDVQIIVSKTGFQKMAKLIAVQPGMAPVKFELLPEEAPIVAATVTIRSEPPGASIFINDKDIGQTTPYDVNLEVGQQIDVRLNLAGYKSKVTTIKLDRPSNLVKNIVLLKDQAPSRQPPKVKVVLPSLGRAPAKTGKKINLSVNTTPWSEVYLDGKKIGVSPFVGARVTQGKHRLRFSNSQLGLKPLDVKVDFQNESDVRCIYDLNTRKGECK